MLLLHSKIKTQIDFKYRITFEYLIGLHPDSPDSYREGLIIQRVGITSR